MSHKTIILIITSRFCRQEWKPGDEAEEEECKEKDAQTGIFLARRVYEVCTARVGSGPRNQ